jgi:hypothetical protein
MDLSESILYSDLSAELPLEKDHGHSPYRTYLLPRFGRHI